MDSSALPSEFSPISRTQPEGPVRFDKTLLSRTKVPFTGALALWETDVDALGADLETTTEILTRFAQAVADASSSSAEADSFLRTLDLQLISADHNWRAIFATIRHQKVWSPEHKQVAMERYLQYLGFRRRLLTFIIERQGSLSNTGTWFFSRQWALEEGVKAGEVAGGGEEFVRLPEGVPVTFDLSKGRMLPIWFADKRFLLVASQPPSVLTDNGVQLYFPRDRNLFGRHPSADVPVPGDYVNVSRAHALVEWAPPFMVTITDLSANGTLLRTGDYRHCVKNQAAGRPE